MLDVAIIGGGVCGLALAHSLQARRIAWQLFEARDRLGGRALTVRAQNGAPLDLGPGWFWPDHQPSITRLVADLGLQAFPQTDDGRVLHLHDPNAPAETVTVGASDDGAVQAGGGAPQPGSLHGGAMRVAGGMGALVQALAKPLSASKLMNGCELRALVDHGSFVELRMLQTLPGQAPREISVQARRVVLALPPRVAEARVAFEPALPDDTVQALRHTATWMASAAKAASAYASPFWQAAGHTGNAWVTHPQAVLAEVFDASTPGQGAALAGFVALGAAARQQFSGGMEMLLRSQLGQLFGLGADDGELHRMDWAQERFTCSPLDLAEDGQGAGHPVAADTLLQAHWQGKLFFGGSETARHGAGYLEGALGAAARLKRDLLAVLPTAPAAGALQPASTHTPTPTVAARTAANDEHLRSFGAWVAGERAQALQRYRSRLHQALSAQDDGQLTQKAVLAALESLYADALQRISALPLSAEAVAPVSEGRTALTPALLAPFAGLADELLGEAVKFNNTSCALSNFPYEHKPPRDYLATIRRDLAAAWQDFARATNAALLAKAEVPA
jgi:monoamine oxidase